MITRPELDSIAATLLLDAAEAHAVSIDVPQNDVAVAGAAVSALLQSLGSDAGSDVNTNGE